MDEDTQEIAVPGRAEASGVDDAGTLEKVKKMRADLVHGQGGLGTARGGEAVAGATGDGIVAGLGSVFDPFGGSVIQYGGGVHTFTGSHIASGNVVDYQFNGLNKIALVKAGGDYQNWAEGFSGFADSAEASDADGDGMTNWGEYVFGLDPTSGASVSPVSVPISKASGVLKYTRRRPALTGVSFGYEFSTTLGGGGWTSFTPALETSDAGDPVEEVSVTVPAALRAGPAGFVRVKAN